MPSAAARNSTCAPRPSSSRSMIFTCFTSRAHSGYARSRGRQPGTARRTHRSGCAHSPVPPLGDLLLLLLGSGRWRRSGRTSGSKPGRGGNTPWRAPQSPINPTGSIGTRTPNGLADAVAAVITRHTPTEENSWRADSLGTVPSKRNRFPTTMSSPCALARDGDGEGADPDRRATPRTGANAVIADTGSKASTPSAAGIAVTAKITLPIHEHRMIRRPATVVSVNPGLSRPATATRSSRGRRRRPVRAAATRAS